MLVDKDRRDPGDFLEWLEIKELQGQSVKLVLQDKLEKMASRARLDQVAKMEAQDHLELRDNKVFQDLLDHLVLLEILVTKENVEPMEKMEERAQLVSQDQ